jgi:hypothetical protein
MPKSKPSKSRSKPAAGKKAKPATAAAAPNLLLVNMIPRSLSHESNQDSEPTLAVNPRNPQQIVGTAFTPDPMGSTTAAPIFLSIDGGRTWTVNSIVPSETQTGDICVGFSPTNGKLYAGILRLPSEDTRLNILRTNDFQSPNLMSVLVDRLGVDQPFLQVAPSQSTSGADRLYVGDNDFDVTDGKTSTIDFSLNGAATKAKFKKARIESRPTDNQNGPQVRPACHADGTVYLAYMGWRASTGNWKANTLVVTADLVVVRDDKGGNSTKPFQHLLDPGDSLPGRRIVQGITFPFHSSERGVPGQQRLGGDVAIAVDPTNSSVVYIAWSDLRAGVYTMHVRRSTDRGAAWSSTDLLTSARGVNPALAINNVGKVGLLYQQLTGPGSMLEWVTHFQRTSDGTSWNDLTLSKAPANRPVALFSPYLGDYDFLLSVGKDFYGIFSANNSPDISHFPNGVIYQRNANFDTRTLLDVDNTTPVPVSIDPFFFKVTE